MSFSSNWLLSFYNNRFIIPLVILIATSFVHLWNPIGFPTLHIDEGIYMLRAMHLLNQGNLDWNSQIYDHPYFGPILIAGILHTFNYPNIVSPDLQNPHSFELLYLFPRLMVGMFAVLDTFLIYAIAKIKYGRNVAIISSLLFALMPLTWMVRRIYLESILLPFILGSILIIVYINSTNGNAKIKYLQLNFRHIIRIGIHENILIVASGIMLGLAVFTKIPAITVIPLLIFYVYRRRKSLLHVLLFITPVVLIPLCWPLYGIYNQEFGQWLDGITIQINRNNDSILKALYDIFLIDPLLLSMGLVGIGFAVIRKKDIFMILWIAPFILFFALVIDYVNWFHLIPIISILCISSGILLEYLFKKLLKVKPVYFFILSLVTVTGMISTIMLISTDVASFQFETMSYVGEKLIINEEGANQFDINPSAKTNQHMNKSHEDLFQFNGTKLQRFTTNETAAIVSSPIYSWIYKYVFKLSNTFSSYTEDKNIKTERVILVVDRYFRDFLVDRLSEKETKYASNLFDVFDNLETLKTFRGITTEYDLNDYPFTSMRYNFGGTPIEIRSNY